MSLTGAEHRRVYGETRRARNAAARARRAAPVEVLRAHDPQSGGVVWVALSRSTPGAGYRIREQEDGRLICGCAAFGWQGACRHVEAVLAAPRGARRRSNWLGPTSSAVSGGAASTAHLAFRLRLAAL